MNDLLPFDLAIAIEHPERVRIPRCGSPLSTEWDAVRVFSTHGPGHVVITLADVADRPQIFHRDHLKFFRIAPPRPIPLVVYLGQYRNSAIFQPWCGSSPHANAVWKITDPLDGSLPTIEHAEALS